MKRRNEKDYYREHRRRRWSVYVCSARSIKEMTEEYGGLQRACGKKVVEEVKRLLGVGIALPASIKDPTGEFADRTLAGFRCVCVVLRSDVRRRR